MYKFLVLLAVFYLSRMWSENGIFVLFAVVAIAGGNNVLSRRRGKSISEGEVSR